VESEEWGSDGWSRGQRENKWGKGEKNFIVKSARGEMDGRWYREEHTSAVVVELKLDFRVDSFLILPLKLQRESVSSEGPESNISPG
jgi:hypothetical protein